MGGIAGLVIDVLCGALLLLFFFATLFLAILSLRGSPAAADADGTR